MTPAPPPPLPLLKTLQLSIAGWSLARKITIFLFFADDMTQFDRDSPEVSAPVATHDTTTTTTADFTMSTNPHTATSLGDNETLPLSDDSEEFSLDESLLESESEQVLDNQNSNNKAHASITETLGSLRHMDSTDTSELQDSESNMAASGVQDGGSDVTQDVVTFECDEFGNPV